VTTSGNLTFTHVTLHVPYSGPTSALFEVDFSATNNDDDLHIDNISILGGKVIDTDNDGISNSLDIDSDNDGISDNAEAQDSATYIASTGLDDDHDGLDNAYDHDNASNHVTASVGLTAVNTDTADNPDYTDTDSNNDGTLDIASRADGKQTTTASIAHKVDNDKDGLLDIFENSLITNDSTPPH
jgi:hypothetical protein